jgi:hypothetical protein
MSTYRNPFLLGSRMPIRKVKGGFKFGIRGKLYRGPGARAKAARQGRAIEASKARRAR